MNCSQDFPFTSVLYPELNGRDGTVVVTAICGVFTLVTILNFVEEVVFFFNNYADWKKKSKILCLLAIYPVISANSLLSVLVPKATPVAEFLSAMFLSFCVLQFVRLVVDYFGGTDAMLKAFEDDIVSFRAPPCCCCCFCLSQVKLTRSVLKLIKVMVLQLSFVRPGILYVMIVLHNDDRYHLDQGSEPTNVAFWLKMLSAVSTMFAVYGLLVTYFAARRKLKTSRFSLKASCIKLTLMLFDIQLTILFILAKYEKIPCEGSRGSFPRAARIHNYLLVVEMFLLSILSRIAYRHKEKTTEFQNEINEMKQRTAD